MAEPPSKVHHYFLMVAMVAVVVLGIVAVVVVGNGGSLSIVSPSGSSMTIASGATRR